MLWKSSLVLVSASSVKIYANKMSQAAQLIAVKQPPAPSKNMIILRGSSRKRELRLMLRFSYARRPKLNCRFTPPKTAQMLRAKKT